MESIKIITTWGVNWSGADYSFGNKFKLSYSGLSWLEDLDKIARKISPHNSRCFTIREALENKFIALGNICKGDKYNNKVETGYFKLKFYKKGSLHIEFKDKELLDKLNQIGGSLRSELGYEMWGKE